MLVQLLTSYHSEHRARLFDVTRDALDAGMPAIQLCWGSECDRELFRVAKALKLMTEKAGAMLVINNRLDVALAVGADALHLGQHDAPIEDICHLIPRGMRLGLTVASPEQIERANTLPIDYYGIGPVFASRTHPAAAIGIGALGELTKLTTRPVVAIGGLTESNLNEVAGTDASGIAVLGAVWRAGDPGSATQALLKKWASLRAPQTQA